ncbi:MAG: NAD-dependent epimerase/dehydratase family protein, partial [Deferribacteres bacterium]|nr:NAD-dependent epimerase/dehydratase family protein [Deferribacteres bacterium]
EYRLRELEKHPSFAFVKCDIEDTEEVFSLFSANSFSAVVNLAARAGVRYSMENPFVYMRTNAYGTLNLLDAAKSHGVKKFVLASTSSLYAGCEMPFKEELPTNTPISPYAASKKAAEAIAYTYHYLYGIDVAVLRYFTVYGPCGRPDMSYFRFIRNIMAEEPIEIYGDGTQSRDFTYIDDIAKGTVKALDAEVGYEIINLGGNKPYELLYMVRMIEELLGKRARMKFLPFHKTDLKATWAEIDKAKRMLNWEPEVSLEEGLERTVRWFSDNKDFVLSLSV